MKKFYNHMWTRYKNRDQHCKRCDVCMNSSNLKGNCRSKEEDKQARHELRAEGNYNFSSVAIFLKVEEIRSRACIK